MPDMRWTIAERLRDCADSLENMMMTPDLSSASLAHHFGCTQQQATECLMCAVRSGFLVARSEDTFVAIKPFQITQTATGLEIGAVQH
jgi:hypothetical protein